ncbi:tetraacyldisaccharide 4'-kinase [Corallincola luteus]|uniref:Tetraacyldisaccharide 4'-kinase n=1 Tax=Corallincola luteus TaxID=1775177 RepID=A0ABY2ALU4_9GAMM|nr:tetraacyldisaccharide 4'-kinase [Corallincola luteus]TCI02485.1 tetraacyldisaccharide 4'-kinase [Corallincola luteus]
MLSPLPKAWYDGSLWPKLLVPFSALFYMISRLRRWFICRYRQVEPKVPVIVVGNISVGGTGKTPLVIWLCEHLTEKGYRVGVVSRGYGGNAPTYPYHLQADSRAEEVGDEPLLIARRTGVPVVVGADRLAAIELLLHSADVDLVISDDGLQHYRMGRHIEIAVIDGDRQLGNGLLLPAGPLRETCRRLSEVDFIIQNGGELGTEAKGRYQMLLEPDPPAPVDGEAELVPIEQLGSLALAAGIGNPQRFFSLVTQLGGNVVKETPLADHCGFNPQLLLQLQGEAACLLVTEKDAVKCQSNGHVNLWYLPISAQLPDHFLSQLCDRINQEDRVNHVKR